MPPEVSEWPPKLNFEEQTSDQNNVAETVAMPVMNKSWFGTPMEEVDPMIFDDTFCVIAKKFGRHHIHRYSCSKSLYLMGPLNPIRRFAIFLTTHRWFESIIVFTILCNCVTLGMIINDPNGKRSVKHETPDFDFAFFMDYVEYVFLVIFSIEMIAKVIAKGLIFNRFSYLRNRWNLLDFVVVLSGYFFIILDINDNDDNKEENQLDFLRTFRILRIFKTFSVLPGLRMMINALINAVVQLVEVVGLIIVFLTIFSLFGMELFQGRLRQKCVADKAGPSDRHRLNHRPISQEPIEDRDRLWTEWVNDWRNWQRREFPEDEPVFCGNGTGARACAEGYTCIGLIGDNPDNGWTTFDSFLSAMQSTFQMLTLDYWERLYDILLSTGGFWSMVFFLLLIFLGAYYLLNLMLAVVAMSYETEVAAQEQLPISTTEKLGLNRRVSNFSFDELSKLNVCKMTDYRKRTDSERMLLAKRIKLLENIDLEDEPIAGQGQNAPRLDDAIFSILGMKLTLNPETEGGKHDSTQAAEDTLPDLDHQPQASALDSADAAEAGYQRKQSLAATVSNARKSEADLSLGKMISSRLSHFTPSAIKWTTTLSRCVEQYLSPVVNHIFFETFITLCIIANTVVLATEHHGGSKQLDDNLSLLNSVFMGVFTVEAILKLMALQWEYFHTGWNIFDLVIVLVSYFDFVVAEFLKNSRSLSVIRSLRLLRVFKLAQSWVTMKVLLNIIFASFGALGNLILVLLIVIYIFAVMGMQVVGKEYTYDAFEASAKNPADFPPWRWQHFWYAFMLVFRVLCGEWIEPLWECLRAQEWHLEHAAEEKAKATGKDYVEPGLAFEYAKCFFSIIPIIIVGQCTLLNLFLALLLNSFDTEELNSQREKELMASGRAENLKSIVGLLMKRVTTVDESELDEMQENEGSESEVDPGRRESTGNGQLGSKDAKQYIDEVIVTERQPRKTNYQVVESKAITRFKNVATRVIMKLRTQAAERAIARMENRRKRVTIDLPNNLLLGNPVIIKGEGDHYDETPPSSMHSEELKVAVDCFPAYLCRYRFCPCKPIRRRSMTVVYRWEKLRSACVSIVGHSAFESMILVLIFASSITLAFEDVHLEEKPKIFRNSLRYASYTFTAIFCIEMILKWFAIGIWGYFTSFWTILDAFIVVVSLVSMYFDLTLGSSAGSNLGALKALRTLRALRPLRAISRWQGMKIVVNALFYAIPSIFNVLLVCLLFWLIFAIMAVQLFKGKFYRCVDEKGKRVNWLLAHNKDECCAKASTHRYTWVNTISNYDNVFEAYLSLFQIATFEGWMELIESSVDATGENMQPIRDSQIEYYLFYVLFIVLGTFFSLRLFIGVIIDNFNTLKKKYEGNMLEILLTPNQRNYYIAMKNLGKKKPKPIIQRPKNEYIGFFYHLATSRTLEVTIFVMIFFNMVAECTEYYGMSHLKKHVLQGCGTFFTTIYFLEALIKVAGLGTFYFTIPWNVYDFILMVASTIDTFVPLSISLPFQPTILRVVRVFRIGRILRPIKAAKGIRKLMLALVVSLPALFNIGALLYLVTFIYAILGMNLFGDAPIKWSIDDMFSFETFLKSNLMLLRLMTAAGWNEVLDSLTVLKPVCGTYRHLKCGQPGENPCPNRPLVVAYLTSYLCLTFLIILNLYIAVILENFVDSSNEEDMGIVEDDLEMFYIRWSRFDPYATQFIDFSDLSEFLDCLDPPLQFKKPNILAIVAFNLPIARGNKIHCLDIIQTMITHVLGQPEDSPEFRKLQHQMERKFRKQFPTRRLLDIVSSSRQWKVEQNAATIVQRAWRHYSLKKHRSQMKTNQTTEEPFVKTASSSEGTEANAKSQHGGLGHMLSRAESKSTSKT